MKRRRKEAPDVVKCVWVEWRKPETKGEKKKFGQTRYVDRNTCRIFINKDKCAEFDENVKTFWHEFCHVFCNFYGYEMTAAQEEDLAYRLESIIWEVLR